MNIDPIVIFEDALLLVVVKPAGMVVNRAETVELGTTLQDWVEKYCAEISNFKAQSSNEEIFVQRSGIAHRLDKETSGVMVIGKSPDSLALLMAQFKARETKKEYVALVHGILNPVSGTINLPIGRSVYNRHKFHIDVFGKNAITEYKVEKFFSKHTLVRLYPKTGRTHQIRVHMAQISHPLVGDEVYGGRKRVKKDREWCPRHFLHAAKIGFWYPENTKRWVEYEAPLPEDLVKALDYV